MGRILMGVETEYAAAVAAETSPQLHRMFILSREHLECLPGNSDCDLYLGNGSRLYLDCMVHPELATPECTNPADVVRYIAAGHRVLERLCEIHRGAAPSSPAITLFRTNVDYTGAGTTWGCHESYLSRKHPQEFAFHLVPHLVSRIIYTGAGGFNPLSPGLEPTLSPRVFHLQRIAGDGSTGRRPIFHTKNESLARAGYNRIHLVCGESLCSHLAAFLRSGVTALIVALIDNGGEPGGEVQLSDSLGAMRRIATDPTCRLPVRLKKGGRLSAIQIQRHYLAAVRAHRGATWMPDWADRVIDGWANMLDRLEEAPASVQTTLDWAIKLALFRDHAEERGVDWGRLPAYSEMAGALDAAYDEADEPTGDDALVELRRRMLGMTCSAPPSEEPLFQLPERPAARAARQRPRFPKLGQGEFDKIHRIRSEFFEIDLRFGSLGPDGLFATLDEAGVLRHAAPGVADIAAAEHTAPVDTRAHARGAVIRSAGKRSGLRCGWDQIVDIRDRRMMTLSDPFVSSAGWAPIPAPPPERMREQEILDAMEAMASMRTRRLRAEVSAAPEVLPGTAPPPVSRE